MNKRIMQRAVELRLKVFAATDKAVLVSPEDDENRSVWLPFSQVECQDTLIIGDWAEMTVPVWLADDKGLLDD